MFVRFKCAIVFVLLSCASVNGQGEQSALRALFDKAQGIEDIRKSGGSGFLLTGNIRIYVNKDSVTDGKYAFMWTPDGKWRQEIVFPGYKRLRIGDGRQFWQVRNTKGESPHVYELSRLVAFWQMPKLSDDDNLKRIHSEKVEGIESTCVQKTTSKGDVHISCFDPESGELVKSMSAKDSSPILWNVQWVEYSQYTKWEDKSYPRSIRGYNGKHQVFDVQFDEIRPAPQDAANSFIPPKDATTWLDCSDGPAWKLKNRISPVYPPDLRQRRRDGAVALYVVIEEDGHLSQVSLATSAEKEFDDAAGSAVAQWTYERTGACADSKGRSEQIISVFFSIDQRHP